jgi:hypothetical protein
MGLFGPKYHCALCGGKAGKMDSFLGDGSKMCFECELDLVSSYVKEKFGKKYDDWCSSYPNLDAKDMNKLQEFYKESKKRQMEFNTTYRIANFVLDNTHGYFAICSDEIEASLYKKNMKYKAAIEVFQISDVIKLEYYFESGFDKRARIVAHLKNKQLPYDINMITIDGKLIETRKAFTVRVNELFDEISKFFQGVELKVPEAPEVKKRRLYEEMFKSNQSYVFGLAFTREELNNKIELLMSVQLPDKCKPLAKRYLFIDTELSKIVEKFKDVDNFESEDDIRAYSEHAKDYINQMINICNQIDGVVVSELDKQAAKMKKGK